MAVIDGENIIYEDGEILFEEGDPGGDLYVIQQGIVEIYRQKDSIRVPLSHMHKGEVIGLFTCLTNKPRTASARAENKVIARKIPYERIKKSLGHMPDWLVIILKEYQIRLSHLIDSYMDQTIELDAKNHSHLSPVYDARIFCSILITLSKFTCIKVDDIDYMLVTDIIELGAESMNTSETKTKALLATIVNSGLLKKTKEPDRHREAILLSQIQKLADFPEFIRTTKLKKVQKLIDFDFTDKTFRVGRALALFAKHQKMKTNTKLTLSSQDLVSKLKNITGVDFCLESLYPLDSFDLIDIEKESENPLNENYKITFIPTKLGRTIAHIIAYKKLKNLDYSKMETEG